MRSYWKYAAMRGALIAIGVALLVGPASAGAATITVDTTGDPVGPGIGCTLRLAISSADTNMDQGDCTRVGPSNDDTIDFASGLSSPITLNGNELEIGTVASPGTLDIVGPGSGQLSVDGANTSRVFNVLAAAGATTIEGLTITHGKVELTTGASPTAEGAGVRNSAASLTLDHDVIGENSLIATADHTTSDFPATHGAGVFSEGNSLTVHDTVVQDNTATATATSGSDADSVTMNGTGITSFGATNLTISFSTVRDNTTTGTASGGGFFNFVGQVGGGVYSNSASLTVDHSTISGNTGTASSTGSTTGQGGGIWAGNSQADISGTTITDNYPGGTFPDVLGGGIYHDSGTANLTSDTLTGNGNAETFGGDNLWNAGGTVNLENAVLAEPISAPGSGHNCDGVAPTSQGHNISDDDSCFDGTMTGDLPDDTNVNLLPLDDYGGPTETRPPSGFTGTGTGPSDAIDVGDVAGQTNDQRGFQRTWQFNVPDGAGDGTDIGAAELQGPTVLDVTPASPGNSGSPQITGFAEDPSDVKLYTTSDCSGSTHGSGDTLTFTGSGIIVSPAVGTNTSTTLYATSMIGTIVSECSGVTTPPTSVTYLRNPVMPVLSSTAPPSGSNNNNPRIVGSADSTATVNLFTSPACTGTPVATGSGANLASPGIAVTVPDNSTTTFYAKATGLVGTVASACSAGITYSEVTPPTPPTPPSAAPAAGPTGQRAAALKKCKKKRGAPRQKCKKKANLLPV